MSKSCKVRALCEEADQATMRHTRLDMTMYYSDARKQQKRDAHGMALEAIMSKQVLRREPEALQ